MRTYKGKCRTRWHIVVAYLWERHPEWIPAPELIKLHTPYGFVGSAGDVRARELARNDKHCPSDLHGKVERAEGREIGKDRRYAYYRYVPKEAPEQINRAALAAFDAA